MLTLRDEYPELVQSEAARQVADSALLLDELISKVASEEPELVARAFGSADGRELLLHGHCHQKAIAGMGSTEEALALAGYDVKTVATACCGMAGSFGFEAEHYEVSEAMARRSLIPAVDAASSEAAIAVTGVSCRQQIGHFSEREPRHAVEWLAEMLATPSGDGSGGPA